MKIVDRFEAWYDQKLAAGRKRSPTFDRVWRAWQRFLEADAGRLAAAISYYGFFAAFSLVTVVYSILGRILGANDKGLVPTVDNYLSQSLPWVLETARQVGRGEVTAIGSVALVLSGVGWVEALRSSQRAIWRLEEHPGNWLIRRIVDLGMLIGLGLLLGLSLATSAAIDKVLAILAPNNTFGNLLASGSGPVLEFAVNFVLAAATLIGVPRLHLSLRRLLPSAIIVTVGIQLLNTVGTWIIRATEHRPAYQLVAGTVGLLIYLYVLNQLVLFGAALAATSHHGKVVDLAAGDRGDAGGKPGDSPGEPRGPGPADTA